MTNTVSKVVLQILLVVMVVLALTVGMGIQEVQGQEVPLQLGQGEEPDLEDKEVDEVSVGKEPEIETTEEVQTEEVDVKEAKIEIRIKLEQKDVIEYLDLEDTQENRQAYIMASLGVMGNVADGMYQPDRLIKESEIAIVKERLTTHGIWVENLEVQTRRGVANMVVALIESEGVEIAKVNVIPRPIDVVEEIPIEQPAAQLVAKVEPAPTRERKAPAPSRGGYTKQVGTFNASAYDLSFQSCGKGRNHPLYGITANGSSLVGQNREQAMTIAADTRVLPMGSKVYVEIAGAYAHYSGIYTVRDRGGAIKGNKIDIFMGDYNQHGPSKEAINFGRRNVKVYKLD